MAFKWSVARAVILAAALLAAGCPHRVMTTNPGCKASSYGTRTIHTVSVSVARDTSDKLVATLSCKNLDVYDDGNSHTIHWVIDSRIRKDWKFVNSTDPTHPDFDLKFVDPSTASQDFVIDHQDLGRDFMIALRDLLDHYNTYPYSLQVHGPNGQTLIVDPAIINHGG